MIKTVKGGRRRLEVGLLGREPCCRDREVDGGHLERRQIVSGVLGSKVSQLRHPAKF